MNKIIKITKKEFIKGLQDGWYNIGYSRNAMDDIISVLSKGFGTGTIKCYEFKTINTVRSNDIIHSDDTVEGFNKTSLYKLELDSIIYYIHDYGFDKSIKAVVKK